MNIHIIFKELLIGHIIDVNVVERGKGIYYGEEIVGLFIYIYMYIYIRKI